MSANRKKPKPNVPPAGGPARDTPTTPEERFEQALAGLYPAICEHFATHGFDAPDAGQCQRIAWDLMLAAHLHCDEADTCWGCFLQEYLQVEADILTEGEHAHAIN